MATAYRVSFHQKWGTMCTPLVIMLVIFLVIYIHHIVAKCFANIVVTQSAIEGKPDRGGVVCLPEVVLDFVEQVLLVTSVLVLGNPMYHFPIVREVHCEIH